MLFIVYATLVFKIICVAIRNKFVLKIVSKRCIPRMLQPKAFASVSKTFRANAFLPCQMPKAFVRLLTIFKTFRRIVADLKYRRAGACDAFLGCNLLMLNIFENDCITAGVASSCE
ncbi:MAG: hypothetical protein IPH12_19300 [Saprospirales bacterium]|nr:hypothetical protein [Saprospirales bacterium]